MRSRGVMKERGWRLPNDRLGSGDDITVFVIPLAGAESETWQGRSLPLWWANQDTALICAGWGRGAIPKKKIHSHLSWRERRMHCSSSSDFSEESSQLLPLLINPGMTSSLSGTLLTHHFSQVYCERLQNTQSRCDIFTLEVYLGASSDTKREREISARWINRVFYTWPKENTGMGHWWYEMKSWWLRMYRCKHFIFRHKLINL